MDPWSVLTTSTKSSCSEFRGKLKMWKKSTLGTENMSNSDNTWFNLIYRLFFSKLLYLFTRSYTKYLLFPRLKIINKYLIFTIAVYSCSWSLNKLRRFLWFFNRRSDKFHRVKSTSYNFIFSLLIPVTWTRILSC